MKNYVYNQVQQVLKNRAIDPDGINYPLTLKIMESTENCTKWVSVPDQVVIAIAQMIDTMDAK